MFRFTIVSPPYPYTEVVLWDGTGPTYDVCDVVEVEAENKSDARVLGVKLMIDDRYCMYCKDQRSEGLNPYDGIKVFLTPTEEFLQCPEYVRSI